MIEHVQYSISLLSHQSIAAAVTETEAAAKKPAVAVSLLTRTIRARVVVTIVAPMARRVPSTLTERVQYISVFLESELFTKESSN